MAKIPVSLRKIFPKIPLRAFSIRRAGRLLSGPLLISIAVLLIIASGWAFYIGYLVGKGQNPGTELAAFKNIFGETSVDNRPENSTPLPRDSVEPEAPQAAEAEPASMENNPDPAAFSRPQGASLEAWDAPPPIQGQTSAPEKGTPKPVAPKQQAKAKGPIYNYTFQAAAFKNEKDAKNLQARLKKAGLNASVKKSGKVYLAIIVFKGAEDDKSALVGKLQSLKLGKPLQLSRQPAAASKKGR